MTDDIKSSILEQIIRYEDNFLSIEKQRLAAQQKKTDEKALGIPDDNEVSVKMQDKPSGDSQAVNINDSSVEKNNPQKEWNRWDINYIFKMWWNYYYGNAIQSSRNIQGFTGSLLLEENDDENLYTIGLLYKIMQVSSEYRKKILKAFTKCGKEKTGFEITFKGAQLYELVLNVGFDNGELFINNFTFNFDVIQQAQSYTNGKRVDEGGYKESKLPEALRFLVSWTLDIKDDISLQSLVEPNDIPGINDSEIFNYLTLRLETRNAKAAIMSRNMSHNIGSHVISYLHNEMESNTFLDIQELCHDLKQIVGKGDSAKSIDAIRSVSRDPIHARREAYLSGIQYFLAYLQERQDYIALISTDLYMPPISTNFKDEVYDVLNPDKKRRRHNGAPAVDNLLLHYMTKSEGISRPFLKDQDDGIETNMRDIVIRFGGFTGSETVHPDLERLRQLNVAFPGGTLGRQAFYSIMENVMRNAAKHDAKSLGNNNLEITIDCYDKTSCLSANDGGLKEVFRKFYLTNDKEEEYYYITLTINVSPRSDDLERLRYAIVEPFVENHSMRDTNKGIKEMRISAAWLRSEEETIFPEFFKPKPIPDVRITSEEDMNAYQKQLNNRPPVLYVREDDNNHLQYIFCLLKNREIAYIVKNDTPEKDIPEFPKSSGWKTYKEKDYYKLGRNTYFAIIVADGVDFNNVAKYSGYRVFQESNLLNAKKIADCDSEQDRHAVVLEILRLSSSYQEGDQIWVGDDLVSFEEDVSNYIKTYPIINGNIPNVSYIYHSHYNPIKVNASNCKFIEEVTGNNSTDRLLRRYHTSNNKSMLDLRWFYTHLLVAKSTILLFDERLFDKMVAESNVKLGLATYDKNIHIYNLIDTSDGMTIAGMDIITTGEYRHIMKCELGTIHCDNTTGELSFRNNIPLKRGNFVSVHQGLFDKMYDKWGITDEEKKKLLVRSFYKIFCHKDEKYNDELLYEPYNYCPGLTVHSGRSIPSRSSMPMNVPFLPFASVDRAFSDCKYSLVELLINAKNQYNRNIR